MTVDSLSVRGFFKFRGVGSKITNAQPPWESVVHSICLDGCGDMLLKTAVQLGATKNLVHDSGENQRNEDSDGENDDYRPATPAGARTDVCRESTRRERIKFEWRLRDEFRHVYRLEEA
ncbi:hypothetical protein HYDPIDRAFT_41998 [Hydnomerulius pinastri MD-312]|uniref:Uncharacterized protein n=1 Tax=Hydnomerulius pinastri MD-312 TaxID=994086 RepID=A0A0C9VVS8_9AGAM|nr:hypothetical protein HYDPIDRAFT_41998 [Hydnomerulius pinastri MD-312]